MVKIGFFLERKEDTEGAESKKQVDRLRDLGCEVIQGYYYSKPIPIAEYDEKYL